MKSIFRYLAFYMCIMLISSCSDDGITESEKNANGEPILELIRLEGDLRKLTQSGTVAIDFGDISATSSLYYLLLNKGTRDAFDVNLTSDEIQVSPDHINVITGGGTENIESLPIIEMTAVHVIPPSGVGGLLPFQLGALSDTLLLDYKFTSVTGDTNTIEHTYPVEGNKLGCKIGMYIDSWDITTRASNISSGFYDPFEGYPWPAVYVGGWDANSVDEVILVNEGNVPASLEIWVFEDLWGGSALHEYSMSPGDSIDIVEFENTSILEVIWASNFLRILCGQYMLSFLGRTYIGGSIAVEVIVQ